ELLGRRLEAREVAPEEQVQVALCRAHLGCLESQAGRTADALLQAMRKTTDPKDLQSLARHLSAASARLGPKEAARLCGPAAVLLTKALNDRRRVGPVADALQSLAQGLSAVS